MKAVLSVVGQDKVGIIAGVSNKLAELNINILDLSQTIMEGYFTMMMVCDISQMNLEFVQAKEALNQVGDKLGMQINIQRQDIFDAMHKL
ncbi:ACT domain-containing protein [Neisseria sp. Ec49-e6-T10]|uniref:ACT domain-containing protein n=1 Tax=Neisseria sp. Ec49-e6-T10 TaxID=3140744 RepID=UPI003EBDE977